MITIKEIYEPSEKSKICDAILRGLPAWFEVDTAIIDYVSRVKSMEFYSAYDEEDKDKRSIGFVAIKNHNKYTSEIVVMGTHRNFHNKGVGKTLIANLEQNLREKGVEFITVKTLSETVESKSYKRTRAFYHDRGFRPLEVFDHIWGDENPCVFMVKKIK